VLPPSPILLGLGSSVGGLPMGSDNECIGAEIVVVGLTTSSSTLEKWTKWFQMTANAAKTKILTKG